MGRSAVGCSQDTLFYTTRVQALETVDSLRRRAIVSAHGCHEGRRSGLPPASDECSGTVREDTSLGHVKGVQQSKLHVVVLWKRVLYLLEANRVRSSAWSHNLLFLLLYRAVENAATCLAVFGR